MTLGPLMVDVAGLELTPEDRDVLRHPLVGSVILFTRNYQSSGLLARLARERPVAEIAPILAQWDRVQRTVRDAVRGSYDGAMVGFEIGNCLAELAPRAGQAAR